jgi:SAM-dependent methyltransferase
VNGKRVLEIGALNVNGSLRQAILEHGPHDYIGTDIVHGPGVDQVCDIGMLRQRFGAACFDVVICTEVLEHVRDWRAAISNMKDVLRPGGVMVVTTRSKGHPYHGYPYDYWRFELSDFAAIFADMELQALEPDPVSPGVFLKARKIGEASPVDISAQALFSMVTQRRTLDVSGLQIGMLKLRHTARQLISSLLPLPAKQAVRKIYPNVSKVWRE